LHRLHIGFVAQRLVRGDGQGRAGLELIRALVDDGHRVTVWTHDIDDDLAGVVTVRRLRRLPVPQLVDDVLVLAVATLAVRRARPDLTVVLGHTARPAAPFVYYAQFSHEAWRSTWTRQHRPGWRHRVHAALSVPLERLVAGGAGAVLGCSMATAESIKSPPSAPRGSVPNGVDDRAGHLPDRAAARAAAGVPEGVVAVGFVGEYFTGRKGLDVLLAAVAAGDEHVVIGGRGDDDWLAAQVAALGLTGRVHPLGFTPPDRVYEACDVVAVPSRYEPFSLVTLEAASLGLPVILTETVGAAEHLGAAAVVIGAPPKADGLRAALDQLGDPSVRADAGEAARAVSASLTWPATARRAASFVLAAAR
jgi:glycosyltransferase involved in cell wall biosynthesis